MSLYVASVTGNLTVILIFKRAYQILDCSGAIFVCFCNSTLKSAGQPHKLVKELNDMLPQNRQVTQQPNNTC